MNEILITVLLCVHSTDSFHDKLLIEAVDSLFKQTYKDFKILIVADACWQSTLDILEKYSKYDNRITLLKKDKKEGLAVAKNFGLSNIDTEWVCFLDADDLYIPEKLQKQVDFLLTQDNIDFIGTQAWNRRINSPKLYPSCFKIGQYETHEDLIKILNKENVLTHGSMMIKKSALDNLKGYNNIRGAEDWDLWKRAINSGYKFHQLQERLYVWTEGTRVSR